MPDFGPEHAEELIRQGRAMLDRLSTVDEPTLEHADWLSLETLRWDLERFIEWRGLRHRAPQFTPYMFNGIGPHGVLRELPVRVGRRRRVVPGAGVGLSPAWWRICSDSPRRRWRTAGWSPSRRSTS